MQLGFAIMFGAIGGLLGGLIVALIMQLGQRKKSPADYFGYPKQNPPQQNRRNF